MVDAAPFVAVRTADPRAAHDLLRAGAAGAWGDVLATYRVLHAAGGLVADDDGPGLHVYEVDDASSGAVVRGLVAAVALDAALRPHEDVRVDLVASLAEELRRDPMELAPVLVVHGDDPALAALLDDAARTGSPSELVGHDGVRHRTWTVTDPAALAGLQAATRPLVGLLADGHHRVAAARALAAASGAGEPPRVMAWLVPAGDRGPRVLGIPRVATFADRTWRDGLVRLGRWHPSDPKSVAEAVARPPRGRVGVVAAGWSGVLELDVSALARRLPREAPPPWARLDAALLDHVVLPALGAVTVEAAPPDDESIPPQPVDGGDAARFLVVPVDPGDVVATVRGGWRMPWKSTWFRPKPGAGVLLRRLDA